MELHINAGDIKKSTQKICDTDVYNKLVKDIIDVIDRDIYAVESVEMLAKEFKISSGHIKNIFKKHTGITIFDYLFNRRMDEAKFLLGNSRLKVSEIAEKLGYKSSAFFSRTFKKFMGITPSEYRNGKI